MRWAGDERRMVQACTAVLEFMNRHPIAASWGRSDLASSEMMSLETSQRVWQTRKTQGATPPRSVSTLTSEIEAAQDGLRAELEAALRQAERAQADATASRRLATTRRQVPATKTKLKFKAGPA